MNFIEFWNKLIFRPKEFFAEDFSAKDPKFLFFTILIYGVSNAMDRMDQQLAKADLKGNMETVEAINNWPSYWGLALVLGIVGGLLFYHLGGWFYNLRIKWSNGTQDRETAKFLYLYPELVPSLIYLLTVIIYMAGHEIPYDDTLDLEFGEIFGSILVISASFYAVYISYIGVTTVTDVDPSKAKLWFLYLPIVLYSVALISIFVLILNFL